MIFPSPKIFRAFNGEKRRKLRKGERGGGENIKIIFFDICFFKRVKFELEKQKEYNFS